MKFHEIQQAMRDTLDAAELGPVEMAACVEGYEHADGGGQHGLRFDDVDPYQVAEGMRRLGVDLIKVANKIDHNAAILASALETDERDTSREEIEAAEDLLDEAQKREREMGAAEARLDRMMNR